MAAQVIEKTVTTDSGGAASVLLGPVHGPILYVQYTKGNYDNGVVFTITTETTLQNIWVETAVNASEVCAPRLAAHSTVGVAMVYAGTDPVVACPVYAIKENIKIVLASGGATKSGTFRIIVGD